MLLRTIEENRVDTIVNLGAGLDTRPYRLPLARSLRWIEVDQPPVLEYKARKLKGFPSACLPECVPLDVTDAAATEGLFKCIGGGACRALVLTEGLLTYLTDEQVAALALGLSADARFRWWLTDLVSPAAVWLMSHTSDSSTELHDVTLQFAPEGGPAFFRPYGWETEEHLSCLDAGYRLDRSFLAKALTDSIPNEHRNLLQGLFTVVKLKLAS
jgi:O-methyltransferase involved in polyketide biosynthesis